MQESGENLKIYYKTHTIYTPHKLSPHTHTQDLTWQECQAKEEVPYLGASLPKSNVHPSTSKWMKPNGQSAAADAAYHDNCRVNTERVPLQFEYQPPLTNNIKI